VYNETTSNTLVKKYSFNVSVLFGFVQVSHIRHHSSMGVPELAGYTWSEYGLGLNTWKGVGMGLNTWKGVGMWLNTW